MKLMRNLFAKYDGAMLQYFTQQYQGIKDYI